jgi:hypothetical protein
MSDYDVQLEAVRRRMVAEARRRGDEMLDRIDREFFPELVEERERPARLERERIARIRSMSQLAQEAFSSWADAVAHAASYLQVQMFGTPEQKKQADRLLRGDVR